MIMSCDLEVFLQVSRHQLQLHRPPDLQGVHDNGFVLLQVVADERAVLTAGVEPQ